MELMVHMMTMIHYPVLIVIDHQNRSKDTPFYSLFIMASASR